MTVKYKRGNSIITLKNANSVVYLESSNKLHIDYDSHTRSVKIEPNNLLSIVKKK